MTAKAQKSKLSARDRGRLLLITDDPATIQHHLLEATGLEIFGSVSVSVWPVVRLMQAHSARFMLQAIARFMSQRTKGAIVWQSRP